MILVTFCIVSLIQFGFYFFNRKVKINIPDVVVLISVLLLYYFIFPNFFYPELRDDGMNCGLPVLGITLAFWFYGTLFSFIIHFSWFYLEPVLFKNKNPNHKDSDF